MKLFIFYLSLATFLAVIIFFMASTKPYQGEVTDHFNGKNFYIEGKEQKKFSDFIKWRRERDAKKWPCEIKLKTTTPPPIAKIEGDKIRIALIGHSTFLIQTAGLNILTDPVFSEKTGPLMLGVKRVTPPAIEIDDLPKIDYILISHNHYDHLDLPSVNKLFKKFKPQILLPLGVSNNFDKKIAKDYVHELDWWQEKYINDQISIDLVPAYHWSKRSILDTNKTLWGGFVIKSNNGNIYFAGDTGLEDGKFFYEISKKYNNIKVALLPIGAYLPFWFMAPEHTSPQDSVEIAQILGAENAIPMHYNTFQLADDEYGQAIAELEEIIQKQGDNLKTKFIIKDFGQVSEFSR